MNIIKWMAFFSLIIANACHADSQQEIQHLLKFVESTACQYERNGTLHTGVEALAHIQKKYDYFEDDIKTAEDFIEYSATKSKMSGNKYQVHCGADKALYSQDWLLKELKRYRQSLVPNSPKK